MIKIITDLPPLPFVEVVREVCTEPLAAHGFHWKSSLNSWKTIMVEFARERHGELEELWFARRCYEEEEITSTAHDDEVDTSLTHTLYGNLYPSRHLMSVNLVAYKSNAMLQTDGSLYQRNNDHFYFADENDLRRVLRERVLPLIVTAGFESFDNRVEDARNQRASKAA